MITGETEVKLSLSINKINIILNALGDQPYKAVADIIIELRQQIQPQLQQAKLTDTGQENVTPMRPVSNE